MGAPHVLTDETPVPWVGRGRISTASRLTDLYGTVIVAVSIVRMVQMAIYQIVNVIAVRYRLMAAVRAMDMRHIVTVANMAPSAGLRIRFVDIVRFADTARLLVVSCRHHFPFK